MVTRISGLAEMGPGSEGLFGPGRVQEIGTGSRGAF